MDAQGQPIVTGFDSIPESMYWAIVDHDDRRLRRRVTDNGLRQGACGLHDDSGLLSDHRANRNRIGRIGPRRGQRSYDPSLPGVHGGRTRCRCGALQILWV